MGSLNRKKCEEMPEYAKNSQKVVLTGLAWLQMNFTFVFYFQLLITPVEFDSIKVFPMGQWTRISA